MFPTSKLLCALGRAGYKLSPEHFSYFQSRDHPAQLVAAALTPGKANLRLVTQLALDCRNTAPQRFHGRRVAVQSGEGRWLS